MGPEVDGRPWWQATCSVFLGQALEQGVVCRVGGRVEEEGSWSPESPCHVAACCSAAVGQEGGAACIHAAALRRAKEAASACSQACAASTCAQQGGRVRGEAGQRGSSKPGELGSGGSRAGASSWVSRASHQSHARCSCPPQCRPAPPVKSRQSRMTWSEAVSGAEGAPRPVGSQRDIHRRCLSAACNLQGLHKFSQFPPNFCTSCTRLSA